MILVFNIFFINVTMSIESSTCIYMYIMTMIMIIAIYSTLFNHYSTVDTFFNKSRCTVYNSCEILSMQSNCSDTVQYNHWYTVYIQYKFTSASDGYWSRPIVNWSSSLITNTCGTVTLIATVASMTNETCTHVHRV